MRRLMLIILVVGVMGAPGADPAWGQLNCDSLYLELQNLAVDHVRANEVWVEHFLDCAPAGRPVGGFVLSELGQEGKKDRVIIASYRPRVGWQYRFSERAPCIRFPDSSPRLDVDGDGELDFVFYAVDETTLSERSYRIVFMADGKKRATPKLDLPRELVIDSLLPAPAGKARPLQIVDRRGSDLGGLTLATAPVSYRYLAWDATLDPPQYVNQTNDQLQRYPMMRQREEFIKALPGDGELRYETPEEYEAFLINLIGWCLDQSNLDRELAGYEQASTILDRVKYSGSTDVLDAPRVVRQRLQRVLPEARKQRDNQNRATANRKKTQP